jgi:threonine dehydrogenase-like Zn-dependent dehydrogenase
MRAAIFNEPHSITVGDRPDAERRPIGHEFVGVVEGIGSGVEKIKKGDFVIAPFAYSDGTCPHCLHGITTACTTGGFFPQNRDGGQGEAVPARKPSRP